MLFSQGNQRSALHQLKRDSNGFYQPDPVVSWLGLDYGERCDWQRLAWPEIEVCAEAGLRLNCGEGANYGVHVHYVGARFYAGSKITSGAFAPEQGRMIGAVLAPLRGRIPKEADLYCACDSIDEEITQVARVLLDQYSVEGLFGQGSLLVVVEHEFAESWTNAKQAAALRRLIEHLAQRWKRLRRAAIQVTVPSFNREALAADPPRRQLRYREALAAELVRVQKLHLSPPSGPGGKAGRHSDLLFSLDRRFDPDESIVELLRRTGRL